jgi:hypothetical protein
LALVLIALGAVAARDVLVSSGAITGSPWIVAALNQLDGLTAQTWMSFAGIGVAALGVLLLLAAVKPRRRTHRPLIEADTWITPRDCIRVARLATESITGVAGATATGSHRRITLLVSSVSGYDSATVKVAVTTAASEALAPMARPPRVRVRIKEERR